MKLTASMLSALAIICAGSGCVTSGPRPGLTPATAASLTALTVSIGLWNSPQTATALGRVQPVVCDLVTHSNPSPAAISAALAGLSTWVKTREAVAILNAVGLYAAATDTRAGGGTNEMARAEFARAIWCDGFARGLALTAGPEPPARAGRLRSRPDVATPAWPLLTDN